ncbi:MAG: hypothetical protein NC928_04735 [Candidatus Omnitrophica bacterium]|nr:hypothetical protein [Candidatus Omnitrophota bacterium]
MDKKDIYEHLARIYLDASSQNKKKKKKLSKKFKFFFFISALLIIGLGGRLINNQIKDKSLNSQIALVFSPDVVKINFNFNPARKEIYSISLNKLDLRDFRQIEFSCRKANYNDTVSLRIEFVNSFNEKDAVYLRDIPYKWQNYQIGLYEFKKISDWSNMTLLSFIIEEWNAKAKKDVIYLDNIRLVR